ncbi:YitT family protein [Butyrivibrio sp. WCD2001]|uniref:YitT family protein n=1 Tax=Butyrivibrio sp. WCD2001 TaxID=1280681 RepID=UPI000426F922|nr:YitT family protein [Butyrivibrio sp. WCD2001]
MTRANRLYNATLSEKIISYILIAIGATIAAFSIEDFLAPNRIFDGGIVGVSMITANFTGFKLSILTWVLNVPFLIFGWKKKGYHFVIRSIYAMTVFAIAVAFFETTPAVTEDYLLAVTFGGLILGVGVGIILRHGGCLDGTEIVASILSPKIHMSIGKQVLCFNIVLYLIVGFIYGWNRGLYSILTYVLVSVVMTRVEEGFDAQRACLIFTHDDVDAIKNRIYQELGRTCTEWNTEGYIGGENKALYVVVSQYELRQIRDILSDFNCFATISNIDEIIGKNVKLTLR